MPSVASPSRVSEKYSGLKAQRGQKQGLAVERTRHSRPVASKITRRNVSYIVFSWEMGEGNKRTLIFKIALNSRNDPELFSRFPPGEGR